MFDDLRKETDWDVEGELMWGYYFTDPDTRKLEQAAQRLAAMGYQLVAIHAAEEESTNVLQVERAEKHTPKTLEARNSQLELFATEFGLESYDGMDVGPVSD